MFQQFKNWHLKNGILPGDFQVKCQLWNIELKHFWVNWEKWLLNTTTDSESLQAFRIWRSVGTIEGNGENWNYKRGSEGKVMQSETLHSPQLTTSSQFYISLLLLWHWIEIWGGLRGRKYHRIQDMNGCWEGQELLLVLRLRGLKFLKPFLWQLVAAGIS